MYKKKQIRIRQNGNTAINKDQVYTCKIVLYMLKKNAGIKHSNVQGAFEQYVNNQKSKF
jgi:hypothetical protein